jgi:signal peptidase I
MAEVAENRDSADSSEAAPSTPPASQDGALREYLQSLLITIILAVFGTTFVVQAFKIPSPSMVPTLLVGDHLLVNKFIFGGRGAWYDRLLPYRPIRHGDVVVFKYPYDNHPYYVKRVIGLPGDRIRIVDQRVYVNGTLLDEPYVVHDLSHADPYMFDFPPKELFMIDGEITPQWAADLRQDVHHGELLVPPHDYFVMGDNRDDSSDSRYWGFVPRSAIVGRPLLIYWSVRAIYPEHGSSSFVQHLQDIAKTLLYLPIETRWRRTFQEVH